MHIIWVRLHIILRYNESIQFCNDEFQSLYRRVTASLHIQARYFDYSTQFSMQKFAEMIQNTACITGFNTGIMNDKYANQD